MRMRMLLRLLERMVMIVGAVVSRMVMIMRLHDEPLLEKIKKCLGMADSEKEEDK